MDDLNAVDKNFSFNRTIIELKLLGELSGKLSGMAFNRTIIELKYIYNTLPIFSK